MKIFLYCGVRTGPESLVTVEERILDIRDRMLKYFERVESLELLEAIKQLERQIQKNLNVSVSEISDESIRQYREKLLKFKII